MEFTELQEGKATILLPVGEQVFYNPVQEFNRDLSVAVIHTWKQQLEIKKPITLLEALGATGLRSIRYSKEIPGFERIVCNDMDQKAVEAIMRNIEFNKVENVIASKNNATNLMYQSIDFQKNFNVIDLDPYGSAAPFLDSAVQCLANDGLLCITCTDMQVLAGAKFPETCFAKYGGLPMRGDTCHEMALRLVLGALHSCASRHKKVIQPICSVSVDFYVRLFVRLRKSPLESKLSASRLSLVFHCLGCRSFELQSMGTASDDHKKFGWTTHRVPVSCLECENKYHLCGPIWNGPLHSTDFLKQVLVNLPTLDLKTSSRISGILTMCSEEITTPLYRSMRSLTTALHCNSISRTDIASALLNAGYLFSISHCNPTSIKTDAPNEFIWDILRAHAKKQNKKDPEIGSVAFKILSRDQKHDVDFTFNKQALTPSLKLVRFPDNPKKNWGPMAKAGKNKKK